MKQGDTVKTKDGKTGIISRVVRRGDIVIYYNVYLDCGYSKNYVEQDLHKI